MGRAAGLAISALAAAALAAGSASSARGTVVAEVPFAAGARQASAVVLVRALGSTTGWGATPAGRARIYTTFRFEVESVLAGAAPARALALPVIGGTLGDRRLVVPGTPEFRPGDRCLLLLDAEDGWTGLAGWTQGVFRVRPGSSGADRVHLHDGTPVAGFRDGRVLGGTEAIALGEFAEEVRRVREDAAGSGDGSGGGDPR
jgi:hypothetical protein